MILCVLNSQIRSPQIKVRFRNIPAHTVQLTLQFGDETQDCAHAAPYILTRHYTGWFSLFPSFINLKFTSGIRFESKMTQGNFGCSIDSPIIIYAQLEGEQMDSCLKELYCMTLFPIPTHGRAKAGWPARTYIQHLCEDTGCCPEDLPRAMNDREEWRERVRDIRAASTIWWWWWWFPTMITIGL